MMQGYIPCFLLSEVLAMIGINSTPEERNAYSVALQADIKLGLALAHLKNTRQFQELLKAYTETLPIKLVKERSVLVKDGLSADNLQQQIDATGMFLIFLDSIEANYECAKADLNSLDTEE